MNTTTTTENPKEAAGRAKCPLHLNPPTALRQMAEALQHGAEKYGEWNWRSAGINATTYIGAAMRHLTAWQDGEDLDPSGLSHLAHVMAGMAIVLDAAGCGMLRDDRNKVPAANRPLSHKEIIAILEPAEKIFERDDLAKVLASEGLPPAPPVPEGYDRWEYRGKGWKPERKAMYATCGSYVVWDLASKPTDPIGAPTLHYLEAVKA